MKEFLIIITRSFPYGKTEPFLENEVKYLAKGFRNIFILPEIIGSESCRKLPDNVVVDSNLAVRNRTYINSALFGVLALFPYYFFRNILNSKSIYLKYHLLFPHTMLGVFQKEYTKFKILKNYIRQNKFEPDNTIFYTYWFHRSALALSILKESGYIKYLVSRVHGVDLHDQRWKTQMIPFRGYILSQINLVLAVSDYARNYMIERVLDKQQHKLIVSKLGVQMHEPRLSRGSRKRGEYCIVTVANLYPLKRIHELPNILNKLKKTIQWVHFGDGLMRGLLLSNANRLSANIHFTFFGQKDNQEILNFYQKNYVDLFISISLSEGGVPVSIMEAQSFGIPVLAVEAGGIPEIVNDSSGKIINSQSDPDSIAKALNEILDKIKVFDRAKISENILINYSSDTNFKLLLNTLMSLK